MQAIKTKYLGPTDHRGSRLKATASGGSVTIPWDYELDTEGNHRYAALALCDKLQWRGRMISGCLLGKEYVHVFDPYDYGGEP